ncbi:MAG TPA: glucosamine-6-phosphate deaminase [Acidobacteriaceae bacterium]|jgi:glucosamine-6-phosphate deaminase
MEKQGQEVRYLEVDKLKLEVHPSRKAASEAAARAAAETLKELGNAADSVGVIFATGASNLDTLRALTAIDDLPWNRVRGFHMDEYLGIESNHPASFRRYLREHLTERVPIREFFFVDGNAPDPQKECQEYTDALRRADPKLCLLGIGENGHLAFNDPGEADFNDPDDMKIVTLDTICREQQLAEGWFASLEDVPEQALTLTIPPLLRTPKLIVSVPGSRKAQIVRRTLEDPISTACPATILRTHPDITIYLDPGSAAALNGLL